MVLLRRLFLQRQVRVTLCCVQVSPLPSNMSESVCSLKFAQRVRSVELSSSSSSCRRPENSSASSSPTHDSVEVTNASRKVWARWFPVCIATSV